MVKNILDDQAPAGLVLCDQRGDEVFLPILVELGVDVAVPSPSRFTTSSAAEGGDARQPRSKAW